MLMTLMKSKSVLRKEYKNYNSHNGDQTQNDLRLWHVDILNLIEVEELQRCERKMLRAIYGGVNAADGWGRKTNRERWIGCITWAMITVIRYCQAAVNTIVGTRTKIKQR